MRPIVVCLVTSLCLSRGVNNTQLVPPYTCTTTVCKPASNTVNFGQFRHAASSTIQQERRGKDGPKGQKGEPGDKGDPCQCNIVDEEELRSLRSDMRTMKEVLDELTENNRILMNGIAGQSNSHAFLNTPPPTPALFLNHETTTPANINGAPSQDFTRILLGRRSSLGLLTILSSSNRVYQSYDFNVTHLIAVDYDPVEKYIYWTERTFVRRAKADYKKSEILVSDLSAEVDGLAVDWVARNMYWSDKRREVIEVSRLNGKSKKILINTNIGSPRAIVLHPEAGMLYWTDWGSSPKIEATYLDGTNRKILVDEYLLWPNGLAIDYPRQSLYWADSGLDRIEVIGLDGNGRKILLAHDHHIFGFTYFNDFVYWTDWRTGTLNRMSVYNSTDRQILAAGAIDLMGIKAYREHPIPQTNACSGDNNGCSHLCFYTPNGAVCDCPDNWRLNPDKKTCTPM